MDDGVAAVRRQFPIAAQAIEERASWDGVFCEICRDFAEAQAELAKWEVSSAPDRVKRGAEYRELIEALLKEITDALGNTGLGLRPPAG